MAKTVALHAEGYQVLRDIGPERMPVALMVNVKPFGRLGERCCGRHSRRPLELPARPARVAVTVLDLPLRTIPGFGGSILDAGEVPADMLDVALPVPLRFPQYVARSEDAPRTTLLDASHLNPHYLAGDTDRRDLRKGMVGAGGAGRMEPVGGAGRGARSALEALLAARPGPRADRARRRNVAGNRVAYAVASDALPPFDFLVRGDDPGPEAERMSAAAKVHLRMEPGLV